MEFIPRYSCRVSVNDGFNLFFPSSTISRERGASFAGTTTTESLTSPYEGTTTRMISITALSWPAKASLKLR